MDTQSLKIAKSFLGKVVSLTIDRPLGSRHPKWKFIYEVNYGYVEGTLSPDGEELDAYLLNVTKPVDRFEGQVISIIHRIDDDAGRIKDLSSWCSMERVLQTVWCDCR